MRETIIDLEQYRVINGPMPSRIGDGPNGIFLIPHWKYKKDRFQIIASDGMGWEHVSVTYYKRNKTPNWDDMCYIKGLFWEEEEMVMELHPPKSQYINNHPHTLHLWKPKDVKIPAPPVILVGAVTAEPA
jgi:hypothetical protein